MHGNVGRASNRADDKRREQVIELVREHYSDQPEERFGPTLAAEHLASDHGTEVARETLRAWTLAAGMWSRRKRKADHTRSQRRAHFGKLIQLDGSHHDWLVRYQNRFLQLQPTLRAGSGARDAGESRAGP